MSNLSRKTIGILIIVAVIIIGVSFAAGMKIGEAKGGGMRGQGMAMQQGQRGQAGQQRQGMPRGGMGGGAGMTIGSILSKDASSITLKLPDGGSKIIYFASSTSITKSASSSAADLSVNGTVMVNGTSNPDGSITAQSIRAN